MAERASSAGPYVLIIRYGYFSSVVQSLGHLAQTLGTVYDGEILAYGRVADARFGRMRILAWGSSPAHPFRERIPFFVGVIFRAMRARWVGGRRLAIVAYDPFQSGMLGLVAKWLTGGALIVELNGDFSHPLALAAPGRTDRALARRMALGRQVLKRAEMVKSLFATQLDGFRVAIPPKRRAVLFNLIDSETFAFAGRRREDFLLFAGHPLQIKGGDVLLRAFAEITGEFPSWRLVMVGHRVEEHARASGVPIVPQVSFSGPVSPATLAELMRTCRGFVLPSRTEGMGRVLIEAATAGAPRLASAVGGVPSFVSHGVDGLLFPPGDARALAETLRAFMSDRTLQELLAQGARERATRDFSSAVYLAGYQRLIADATA